MFELHNLWQNDKKHPVRNVLMSTLSCGNVEMCPPSPPPCIKCVFSAAGLSLSTFYGLSFTQENFLLTWLDWYLLVLDHSGKYWVQRVWSTKLLVIYLCVKHHIPYLVVFILEVFPNLYQICWFQQSLAMLIWFLGFLKWGVTSL